MTHTAFELVLCNHGSMIKILMQQSNTPVQYIQHRGGRRIRVRGGRQWRIQDFSEGGA